MTSMLDVIETIKNRFQGRWVASNDTRTVIRFVFPFEGKALRFRDEMIALGITTHVQKNSPTAMVIELN